MACCLKQLIDGLLGAFWVAAIVVSAKMPRFCVFVTSKTLLLTALCSFIVLGDRGTSETMDMLKYWAATVAKCSLGWSGRCISQKKPFIDGGAPANSDYDKSTYRKIKDGPYTRIISIIVHPPLALSKRFSPN